MREHHSFNLVPAFPLDGGRVLRAAVWAGTRDRRRATLLATQIGGSTAWVFILFGIWIALTVDVILGMWLALMGWFLQSMIVSYRALQGSVIQTLLVSDAMNDHAVTVSPDRRLDSAVRNYLLHQRSVLWWLSATGDLWVS